MKREDIHIRDPFVLNDDGKYYLFGSTDKNLWYGECHSFEVYQSDDLQNFSEPIAAFERPQGFWSNINYWAPEVHKFNGKYYMFASFRAEGKMRGSQILASDSPLGKFLPITDGPFTPTDWSCLDATLYVEDGIPYAVFCHEWTQVGNGEICLVRLSSDLKRVESPVKRIFSANEAWWTSQVNNELAKGYITDGPFLFKLKSGKLLMIWSSDSNGSYAVGMAVSDSGSVLGEFRHINEMLFSKDGGHAMLFKDNNGKLFVTLHAPNVVGDERPCFFECVEEDDRIRIKE